MGSSFILPALCPEERLRTASPNKRLSGNVVRGRRNPPYGSPARLHPPRTDPPEQSRGSRAPRRTRQESISATCFPPRAPPGSTRCEASLVRLVWHPVAAPDLAGYGIFRSEGNSPPVRLTKDLVVDPTYDDTAVQKGHRYVYTVRAYNQGGKRGASSPPATQEPYNVACAERGARLRPPAPGSRGCALRPAPDPSLRSGSRRVRLLLPPGRRLLTRRATHSGRRGCSPSPGKRGGGLG